MHWIILKSRIETLVNQTRFELLQQQNMFVQAVKSLYPYNG